MSERCSDSDFHSATISPITVLMRHGFSMANAQRIIVSRVENGTLETFGLHETGKAQVAESAANLSKRLEELLQPGSEATGAQRSVVRIVSSPFSRTRETAMILADVLRGSQLLRTVEVIEDVRLRERNFGISSLLATRTTTRFGERMLNSVKTIRRSDASRQNKFGTARKRYSWSNLTPYNAWQVMLGAQGAFSFS